MFEIRQFDVDEAKPVITDDELRRRWAQFHGNIHMVSGNRLRRTIGRMLGEDTRRYHVARFFGRPLLKVIRAVRGTTKPEPTTKLVVEAPDEVFFPINYRPHLLDQPYRSDEGIAATDVTIVRVDESASSPDEFITTLNDVVSRATTTWLLIADSADPAGDATLAREVLRTHARDDDDVVFADEYGPTPHAPTLKSPAVGPHTLLSYNVVGRPALIRIATIQRVGGFSKKAGWAYEHDLFLRLSEIDATFHHVAELLLGGRRTSSFDRSHLDADTMRVVKAALDRRGWIGSVEPGAFAGLVTWRVAVPSPAPSIDIVIPTRDRVDLMRQCITAITEKSTYPNYNIIILDNDSVDPETLAYFRDCPYQVVPCPGPFNYAHIVNRGVARSSADFVVTLNNDTIVVTPDWLERLVSLAALPDVGFVGACLLDQDGRREHESIVISPYPQHLRTDSNYWHADSFVNATRDVAAVTGAVQMVERAWWNELGGMDEQLKVVMNDVDICLRSHVAGRYVVYTPDVQLYHHVSSSRGTLDPLDDRNRFIRRWDIFGTFADPYFPESLLLLGETMYYRFR